MLQNRFRNYWISYDYVVSVLCAIILDVVLLCVTMLPAIL